MTSLSSVAHYKITTKLGEGGMGAVYRATDTKLGRDVAIKVLPDSLAGDADRLARFTREAQVLASLNHPNIAAIYGVEDRALVLELVEGPTLAERLAHGPIPLDEALPIARQIAEAMEFAHERAVIHRDLKPANIKVREDGTVKVLDFGLAKAFSADSASGSSDAMNSPTLTARATQLGVILGTAAYMAPEQAKGKTVDRRADIWAFGVVLYEMLTGERGYQAEDVSDTLAAVLTREVDWTALPVDTPPRLRASPRLPGPRSETASTRHRRSAAGARSTHQRHARSWRLCVVCKYRPAHAGVAPRAAVGDCGGRGRGRGCNFPLAGKRERGSATRSAPANCGAGGKPPNCALARWTSVAVQRSRPERQWSPVLAPPS